MVIILKYTLYIKKNYQLTRYTKEEFKRYVHQYLIDNNFNNNFNKDIIAIVFNILTLTTVPTTTSSNFFYNNYGVEYFMTLNRLILIKTAKNIVIFMNNNAFTYNLTGMEPGSTKFSTVRRGNISNKNSNNKGKSTTYFYNNNIIIIDIKNLFINIDLFNC